MELDVPLDGAGVSIGWSWTFHLVVVRHWVRGDKEGEIYALPNVTCVMYDVGDSTQILNLDTGMCRVPRWLARWYT